MAQEFTVVIERDEEGYLVASVPSLPGCHTQARSLDELLERIKEAIRLCLEVQGEEEGAPGTGGCTAGGCVSRLPALTGAEVVRALEQAGF